MEERVNVIKLFQSVKSTRCSLLAGPVKPDPDTRGPVKIDPDSWTRVPHITLNYTDALSARRRRGLN